MHSVPNGIKTEGAHGTDDFPGAMTDVSAKIEKTRFALAGIFLLLSGMTAYLIYGNYTAHRDRTNAVEQQFRNQGEKLAMSIDAFIARRCRDIESLAESKAVYAYFANEALGMSMQYGLKASLDTVSEDFDRIIADAEAVGRIPILVDITLLDSAGRVVVRRRHPAAPARPRFLPDKFIVHNTEKPAVALNGPEPDLLIISNPVKPRRKELGAIVAAVCLKTVLSESGQGVFLSPPKHIALVSRQSGRSCLPDRYRAAEMPDLPGGWLQKINIDGAPAFLIHSPLERFPLCLLTEIGATDSVFGVGAEPLTAAISILMACILSGEIFLLRVLTRHFRLQASYEAAARQEKETADQNRRLQIEISERIQAEKALRTSEQRLELALTGADLGTWDWDVRSGRVVFNARWAEMLGYRLEDIDSHVKSWEHRVHPDDMPEVLRVLTDHLEGNTDRYESEHRLRAKSGEWKWILDQGKVTDRDANGRPVRAVGTHLDITERRFKDALIRAERDLGSALSRAVAFDDTLSLCLEKAIEVSRTDCGVIYLVSDSDGSLVLAVHRGLPESFVTAASRYDADSTNYRLVMKGEPVYTRHERLRSERNEDLGAERLKAIAVLPIRSEDRVIACMNLASHELDSIPPLYRDAMERFAMFIGPFIAQAAQKDAIQRSRSDLETLFNTVADFLFILDMKGRIIRCNTAVTKKLGFTGEELAGASVLLLHPESQHKKAEKIITDMLAGRGERCDIPLLRKSGGCIPVETRVTRGRWEDREVLIGISRDITERLKAETELKKYQGQLETMVRERTRDLEQTQKALVNKALEAGYAHMAAMVLHNVGNIITPLYLHLERIQTTPLNRCLHLIETCYRELDEHRSDLSAYVDASSRGGEEFSYMKALIAESKTLQQDQQDRIQKIQEGIHHIGEILTIQQSYARHASDIRETADVNRIVSDILQMQAAALKKRGIAVETDLSSGLLFIHTSKAKLSQVLVNIVKNAYEAIEAWGKDTAERRIRVRTRPVNEGIAVAVRDTGVGIDPDTLRKILAEGISTKGSTGFGLGYCRMYMEQIGGSLAIDSEKGKGTTVTLVFPAPETSAAVKLVGRAASTDGSGEPDAPGKGREAFAGPGLSTAKTGGGDGG